MLLGILWDAVHSPFPGFAGLSLLFRRLVEWARHVIRRAHVSFLNGAFAVFVPQLAGADPVLPVLHVFTHSFSSFLSDLGMKKAQPLNLDFSAFRKLRSFSRYVMVPRERTKELDTRRPLFGCALPLPAIRRRESKGAGGIKKPRGSITSTDCSAFSGPAHLPLSPS